MSAVLWTSYGHLSITGGYFFSSALQLKILPPLNLAPPLLWTSWQPHLPHALSLLLSATTHPLVAQAMEKLQIERVWGLRLRVEVHLAMVVWQHWFQALTAEVESKLKLSQLQAHFPALSRLR